MDRRSALRASTALDRLGIASSAFRIYERIRGIRAQSTNAETDLPLPPPSLRYKVTGTTSIDSFLGSGGRDAAALRRILGDRLSGSVLDFGCGCGRIARHLLSDGITLTGCDYNPRLVTWSQRHLPFKEVRANDLAPPLPWPAERFDVIYAVSVLTHWPEELQRQWMSEWRRVLRPGGLLVATTHGPATTQFMLPDEHARFAKGELVVRHPRSAGSNLCVTYHPHEWIAKNLTDHFQLVGIEEVAIGRHDVLVMQAA